MKTQAWGWLVAGVLAAGLNANYHNGGLQWAHAVVDRVADRSEEILALASGRTDRLVEVAQRVQDRNEAASCRMANALARAQNKLARSQTQFARWESSSGGELSDRQVAQLDRLEASRIRIQDRVNAQLVRIRVPEVPTIPVVMNMNMDEVRVHTACPRVRVAEIQVPQVHVPQIRVPQIRVPQVHVSIPAVHIEAPQVDVDDDDSGPI